MKRRDVLALCVGVCACPSISEGQPSTKVAKIAILHPTERHRAFDAFRSALHDLGWVEGQTVAFDYRITGESVERVTAVADEIVRSRPDVVVTGVTLGAMTMKR